MRVLPLLEWVGYLRQVTGLSASNSPYKVECSPTAEVTWASSLSRSERSNRRKPRFLVDPA